MNQRMGKRIAVYVVGILILALGVFLNVKCALGVSTTNSVPNVINIAGQSMGVSWMTLGWACTIIYVVDVLFQCIVYRQLRWKVILQIPLSVVFGRIVDMYGLIYALIAPAELDIVVRTVFLICSIILTAAGIAMVVNMDFVPNPPDGGVQALAQLTGLEFGHAKWLWDGILLVITAGISLAINITVVAPKNIFIGTIVAFFTIGNIIHWINKTFGGWFTSIYDKNAAQ